MNPRNTLKTNPERRRGGFPWWAWAIVLASGLSALVGWLIRRRAAQEQPILLEARPSPRLLIPQTPVQSISPVVQEIPIPVQQTVFSSRQAVAEDDLTVLEGIGPVIANVLRQAGITTYAQLAETSVTRLREILRKANLRLGDPTTWPEQAKLLATGDREGFQALTETLRGGRRVS